MGGKKRSFFFSSFSPDMEASPANGDCTGTVRPEVSFSPPDRAISAGWKRVEVFAGLWIASDFQFPGAGKLVGTTTFFFSCWSKIMFCLGPKPHAPGSPAPCCLAPVLVLSTASPSARHFLAWEPRGRVPHKSFAASESQSPLSSLDPDSGSGMEAATG